MMELSQYLELYRRNLFESVVPFWLNNSLDRKNGGTYSCIERDGNIYDTKKYVWLLGRSVWMFSRLYNVCGQKSEYLEAAKLGVDFLDTFAEDDKGRYYFSLTETGKPYFYQRKPYGAVFAMLGYLEYAKASGKECYKQKAVDIFWRINKWIESPELLGRPTMAGMPRLSNLANVMVLASMAIELVDIDDDPRYLEIMTRVLQDCRRHFNEDHEIFVENSPLDECDISQQPEGRFFNPGHSIEVAWFLLHIVRFIPDEESKKLALSVLKGSIELGWDKEFGGIYCFMDIGGKPTIQLESSMKLWWPHTEAIYALVLAYRLTKEKCWLNWLQKVHDYTFKHFVDNDFGGWFGYCDRQGNLTHTCKGGNYKGFFHVPRALLFSIRELECCLGEC